MEEDTNVTTRLLTLLNVSALKSSKRKRAEEPLPQPPDKLNKRRTVQFSNVQSYSTDTEKENGCIAVEEIQVARKNPDVSVEDDNEGKCGSQCSETHTDFLKISPRTSMNYTLVENL